MLSWAHPTLIEPRGGGLTIPTIATFAGWGNTSVSSNNRPNPALPT